MKPDQVEVLPNEKVNVVDTKDSKKECENPESRSEEDVGGAGGGWGVPSHADDGQAQDIKALAGVCR